MVEQGSYRRINGADLYVESTGIGDPIVFLHAGIADCRMWDDQWEPFGARHRVIRYDLRGFGRSTMPAAGYSHVADLKSLLDQLGIDAAVLVAASYGGEVALGFALEHPERVRALVLVGTLAARPSEASDALRAGWQAMERAFDRGDFDEALEIELHMWVDGPSRSPADVDPDVRARVHEMDAVALRREVERDAAPEIKPDPPLRTRLQEIGMPTIILVGTLDMADAKASAERLAASIPGGSRIDVTDAAHLPGLEQPLRFNQVVLDWIAEVARNA